MTEVISMTENKGSSTAASEFSMSEHAKVLHSIFATDYELTNSVTAIRKGLSAPQNPPIQEFIDSGLTPIVVYFLRLQSQPMLQFESAWVLTNVASGNSEQTKAVINAGAIPVFINLLQNPKCSFELHEQCIWALGNIIGDSTTTRDLILNTTPLMEILVRFEENYSKATSDQLKKMQSLHQQTVWVFSQLCRGTTPKPDFEKVKKCLPYVSKQLLSEDGLYPSAVADAAWALSYLTDGPNNQITEVLNTGIAGCLVELLSRDVSILRPVMKVVGNIISGENAQAQQILDQNVLPVLAQLTDHRDRKISKEALWACSNVMAGSSEQIQMALDCDIISKALAALTPNSTDLIKTEVLFIICNALSGGSTEQVSQVINKGVIPVLIANLGQSDRTTRIVLEGVERIIEKSEGHSVGERTIRLIKECGVLPKLEALLDSDNTEIVQKALNMLTFFCNHSEQALNNVDLGEGIDFGGLLRQHLHLIEQLHHQMAFENGMRPSLERVINMTFDEATYDSEGASEDSLASLPRTKFDESAPSKDATIERCLISQEEFIPGDIVVTLPCTHAFKEEGILHWLRENNSCPCCRGKV